MMASSSDTRFYIEVCLALAAGIIWLLYYRQSRELSSEIKSMNNDSRRRLTELLLRDAVEQGADKIMFGEPCDDQPRMPTISEEGNFDDSESRELTTHREKLYRSVIMCSKGDRQIDPQLKEACATQQELHDALLALPMECRTPNGQIPIWFHTEDGWKETDPWQPRSYVLWLGAFPDHFVSVPNQKPWQGCNYIRVPREGQKTFYVKCRVCVEANYCLSIELLERFVEK